MSEQTINGVAASAIVRVVQRIEEKHGVCHPSMLVEAAKRKDSPIHNLFDWDDTEAARHWRTHQARNVINKIRVVVEGRDEPVPAFVHVSQVTDSGVVEGYMTTTRALAGPTREGVVRDALSHLKGCRRRWEQLSELAPIWAALDQIEESEKAAA